MLDKKSQNFSVHVFFKYLASYTLNGIAVLTKLNELADCELISSCIYTFSKLFQAIFKSRITFLLAAIKYFVIVFDTIYQMTQKCEIINNYVTTLIKKACFTGRV